jgi:cell division protein FtsI/penicillin-binding protein 2
MLFLEVFFPTSIRKGLTGLSAYHERYIPVTLTFEIGEMAWLGA